MSEYFFYLIMCIAFCIIIIKLSLKKKFALDFDFNKPQSVHKKHTPRVLGISFIFMLTFILFLFEIDSAFKYIVFCSILCASVGIVEDFNFNISPKIRFIIQIISLILCILIVPEITFLDNIQFLPSLFQNDYFKIFFTIFAIVTIVNSFNFMDGLDGFVILYCILISCFLIYLIHDQNINNFLYVLLLHLVVILFFNFPISNAFLGDFGSYFLGYLFAILFIYIDNSSKLFNYHTSSWLLANLFAYPVFEIFSTIIRRLMTKKSPFYPDNLHLHSTINKIYLIKFQIETSYVSSITLILIISICLSPLLFLSQIFFSYLFFAQFLFYYLLSLLSNFYYDKL